jgi:hypothetical protein
MLVHSAAKGTKEMSNTELEKRSYLNNEGEGKKSGGGGTAKYVQKHGTIAHYYFVLLSRTRFYPREHLKCRRSTGNENYADFSGNSHQ